MVWEGREGRGGRGGEGGEGGEEREGREGREGGHWLPRRTQLQEMTHFKFLYVVLVSLHPSL